MCATEYWNKDEARGVEWVETFETDRCKSKDLDSD